MSRKKRHRHGRPPAPPSAVEVCDAQEQVEQHRQVEAEDEGEQSVGQNEEGDSATRNPGAGRSHRPGEPGHPEGGCRKSGPLRAGLLDVPALISGTGIKGCLLKNSFVSILFKLE